MNKLELVWVQDILDDSNCTPVLCVEDGHPYLYISTSFHYGWRSYTTANVPIWKIDAENGEIVAAMIDGEATVKTFKRVDGDVWLMPHNPMFEPIPGNDAVILGKVVTVVRKI